MVAADSNPVAAQAIGCGRAIRIAPTASAAAMTRKYPAPMSGVPPRVPGRSITCTSARSVSEMTARARAMRSNPAAGSAGSEMTDMDFSLQDRGFDCSSRRFEDDRAGHGDAARESGDALAGDPGGVEGPATDREKPWRLP